MIELKARKKTCHLNKLFDPCFENISCFALKYCFTFFLVSEEKCGAGEMRAVWSGGKWEVLGRVCTSAPTASHTEARAGPVHPAPLPSTQAAEEQNGKKSTLLAAVAL